MAVWVLTEWRKDYLKDISFGLLGEAKRVTDSRSEKLSALVLGEKSKEEMQKLYTYGADEVILVNLPGAGLYHLFVITKILTKLINEFRPGLLLFAANHLGNELAGRLSVLLEAGLVTNANRLELEDGQIVIVKNTYSDRVENKIRTHRAIQLVTLKAKELQSAKHDFKGERNIIRPQIALDDDGIIFEVVDYVQGDPKNIDLVDAEVVVSGGKGVGEKREFELIYELANLLGASVGGSRESVDRGWLPFSGQIGQTGKTVSPRCIITIGISGATQFLKGIEDAEYVIAVNNDKRAPIFRVADLKILGDLHEIVPALLEYTKKLHRLSQKGTKVDPTF